jgi:hypothetical protein
MVEWMKRLGLLLAASAIVLMGCQGSLITYKGTTVRADSRIALPDGTDTHGRYRSNDLIIDYHAVRNGDALDLSGTAQYSPGIENSYTSVPVFCLSVLLADQNGTVLEDKSIATPGSNETGRKMRFRERMQLPPGTANMSFRYNGEARGGAKQGGGGDVRSFWKIPIER